MLMECDRETERERERERRREREREREREQGESFSIISHCYSVCFPWGGRDQETKGPPLPFALAALDAE